MFFLLVCFFVSLSRGPLTYSYGAYGSKAFYYELFLPGNGGRWYEEWENGALYCREWKVPGRYPV
jgi:hypothetical protein